MDIIMKLIERLNSSVFVLLLVLFAIFWTIHKVSTMMAEHGSVCKRQDKFDENIYTIKNILSKINARVDLIYEDKRSKIIKSQSPASLTKIGEEIAENTKIREIIENNWGKIRLIFDQIKFDNQYDIQVAAIENEQKIFQTFDKKDQTLIKEYAFENGLNLFEIYAVISLIVRDKILAERKK
jgi:hypothetical protein